MARSRPASGLSRTRRLPNASDATSTGMLPQSVVTKRYVDSAQALTIRKVARAEILSHAAAQYTKIIIRHGPQPAVLDRMSSQKLNRTEATPQNIINRRYT